MVKKIIACADIHIPSFKGIEEIKKVLQKFIEECKNIINQYDREEVRIVIVGDIFHNKISITNESILAANWFFEQLDKICKTIVIAGNHDMLLNNLDRVDSLTSIFNISKYKNIIFLDKKLNYKSGCMIDDNIVWCLYSSFDAFSKPLISAEKVKNPNKIYVGLIHGDINGAITATGYLTEKSLNPDIFEGCDFVIAGHIHKQQEIKKNGVKIVYCSSINQKDFGESILGHGYILWNLDKINTDDMYEFREIDNTDYGFYKFSINNIEDLDNDDEILINLQ